MAGDSGSKARDLFCSSREGPLLAVPISTSQFRIKVHYLVHRVESTHLPEEAVPLPSLCYWRNQKCLVDPYEQNGCVHLHGLQWFVFALSFADVSLRLGGGNNTLPPIFKTPKDEVV